MITDRKRADIFRGKFSSKSYLFLIFAFTSIILYMPFAEAGRPRWVTEHVSVRYFISQVLSALFDNKKIIIFDHSDACSTDDIKKFHNFLMDSNTEIRFENCKIMNLRRTDNKSIFSINLGIDKCFSVKNLILEINNNIISNSKFQYTRKGIVKELYFSENYLFLLKRNQLNFECDSDGILTINLLR